jgi:hypothetical protein
MLRRPSPPVLGVTARRPRPTAAGALWLALLAGLPVFVVLTGAEWLWRLLAG